MLDRSKGTYVLLAAMDLQPGLPSFILSGTLIYPQLIFLSSFLEQRLVVLRRFEFPLPQVHAVED